MLPEEIQARANEETKRIVRWLTQEDPLGIIIRGHLYIESNLIQLSESALPVSGAIDLAKLNFPNKLDLAMALNVRPKTESEGYTRLNALRNQLAHKIDVEFSDIQEKEFYKSLSETQKTYANVLLSDLSPGIPWLLLKRTIAALCVQSATLLIFRIYRPEHREFTKGR